MFRKLIIGCALAALTVGFMPLTDASASPPEQVEVPDYIPLFLDLDEGKSAWINITAVDFCTWALGGFAGPAPVVDAAVPATVNYVGEDGVALRGAIATSGLYIEVWNLDDPETAGVGACEDILDQLLAGGQPWARGTTSVTGRISNLFGLDAKRAISEGINANATLTTTEGGEAYRYRITGHFGDRCFDFRCAVTNTTLRPI